MKLIYLILLWDALVLTGVFQVIKLYKRWKGGNIMGNKKYYWLKLKEDFFEEDAIEWMEEQENGKDYCLFYLKLCLKSLKTNGILIRNVGSMLVPYDAKTLARITNTDLDTVKVAMGIFTKIGLVEILENGEIYMTQLKNMVGSETNKAQLMRNKREREKKLLQEGNDVTSKSNNVTEFSNNVTEFGNNVTKSGNIVTQGKENCYTEIEIDIDIEKEKKKEPKHAHGEHKNVKLTDEEHNRLIKDYGQEATEKAIQFLDNYMVEKVYKSKSHNMALRRWVFDAVKEREQKQAKMQPKNSFNSFSNQNKYTASEMSELEKQLVENMGDW